MTSIAVLFSFDEAQSVRYGVVIVRSQIQIIGRILGYLDRDRGPADPAHPRQAKRGPHSSRAPPENDLSF